MTEVFAVLNEALANKDLQLKWANEDKAKLEQALNDALAENLRLRAEIDNLQGDLDFYKPKGSENK
jgi:cell division protein FtsB